MKKEITADNVGVRADVYLSEKLNYTTRKLKSLSTTGAFS